MPKNRPLSSGGISHVKITNNYVQAAMHVLKIRRGRSEKGRTERYAYVADVTENDG